MADAEGGVQADAGDRDAEAARSDQPHGIAVAGRQEVGALQGVEPGRDHGQGADAAAPAFIGDGGHGGRRYGDDRQVGRFREDGDRRQAGHALYVQARGFTA